MSGSVVSGSRVRLRIYHLGTQIAPDWICHWSGVAEKIWQPPREGGHGYLAVAELISGRSQPLATAACGIDVSARWTDFPRYGYLSHFGPELTSSAGTTLEGLKRFHIDGLQFYDWQWKHHHPLPQSGTWVDIAKRPTSAEAVRAFIREAHSRNIACMAYNLGFGAVDGFEEDGISPDWLLYRDAARKSPYALTMPAGWATEKLYLLDPANAGWRSAIYLREKAALQSFGFDGWHMDQLGDLGTIFTASGKPVVLKNGFPALLAGAKANVPGSLIFNNVGGYGLAETLSSPVDAMYLEAWHWMGQKTYSELHRTIEQMRSSGKPAILAAYMNYERAKEFEGKPPGSFNLPGVLLADATIFASGGFHLELGDASKMLCNEYFPNHNLEPTKALLQSLQAYYDFVVAYEDVLSGADVRPVSVPVPLEGGVQGSVWTFCRQRGDRTIVHMINIAEPEKTEWRDPEGSYDQPKSLRNIRVKLTGTWHSAFVATPDDGLGVPHPIPIKDGQLTVPRLDYWTMIVLE
jgi:dextranase